MRPKRRGYLVESLGKEEIGSAVQRLSGMLKVRVTVVSRTVE